MASDGASFILYLTSRKALFPCFVILVNGGDYYIDYKHFANMKATIYGNRVPRGMQVKKVGNYCYIFCTEE
jgi:hypothetical protein